MVKNIEKLLEAKTKYFLVVYPNKKLKIKRNQINEEKLDSDTSKENPDSDTEIEKSDESTDTEKEEINEKLINDNEIVTTQAEV